MRSCGSTTVSRTSERIDSLRRRRRGRRVSAAPAVIGSAFDSSVRVVIFISMEVVGTGAFGRTELAAAVCSVRAVGAEVRNADAATLEVLVVLALAACLAH